MGYTGASPPDAPSILVITENHIDRFMEITSKLDLYRGCLDSYHDYGPRFLVELWYTDVFQDRPQHDIGNCLDPCITLVRGVSILENIPNLSTLNPKP